MLNTISNHIKKRGKKGILLLVLYVIFKWTVIILLGKYLQTKSWWNDLYFLAFPVIILTVLLIKKHRSKNKNTEAI